MKLLNNLAVAAMLSANSAGAEQKPISVQEFSAKTHLDISVEHGIATLTGTVVSWYQSLEAENNAELIDGVVMVRNRVKVA